MIWWAVIYWIAINTMGVGVIVGSMCPIKKKTNTSSVKNEEYSPDYFKDMVKANEANAMNKILKEMSDYFAKETSTSMYLIDWDTYNKVPFSMLSETFNKYGVKMLNLCNSEFTHKDYCKRYTLRVKIMDKETVNTGVTYMKG